MLSRNAILRIRQINGQAQTKSIWNSARNCAIVSKKTHLCFQVLDLKIRSWATAGHKNWTAPVHVRCFAIRTEITEAEYHAMADAVLDVVLVFLDFETVLGLLVLNEMRWHRTVWRFLKMRRLEWK